MDGGSGAARPAAPVTADHRSHFLAELRAGGHNLAAEREGSTQDTRVLGFDAARAFWQALANEQVLVAARSRLDRAQANLDDAKARADAGLPCTNGGTRAALDVASAARDVAQQRGSVQRADLGLELIVGQTVTGPLASPASAARIEP